MAVTPVRGGFWLQHASNEARQLVAFADELARTPAGRPGVALGPLNAPTTLNALYQQARSLGATILDPHGEAIDLEPTQRATNHYPWLVTRPRPVTQVDWEAWMQSAVDHQLSSALRGATPPPSFLITPSPIITAAAGTTELHAVLDAAAAVPARQTQPCWTGVTVDRDYMRDQPHLTRLLNAMVATGATGFVFRASHSELPPVQDQRYLEGLHEVVATCATNDVSIYLPNSGWLGWLAMAWGAWAFSGGMSSGSWCDRVNTPMRRPDEPARPYFEPQLLRSVRWAVHERLAREPTYAACACPDCVLMGANHDLMLAKRHQLRLANNEAAALQPLATAQRRALVQTRVTNAIAFRDGLSRPTQDAVQAGFLDRWLAVL